MSKALQEAGHLKPEVRLGQAIESFKHILSEKERTRFDANRRATAPTPKDVYRLTAEISKHSKIDQRFGPRLTGVLQAVQQYTSVIDLVVSGSQNLIASSVWAVLRSALLTALNVQRFFERLSKLLMNMGRHSPRYESLVALFPSSKELKPLLHEYLIVIVTICRDALVYLKANPLAQTIRSFDSKFEAFEAKLQAIATDIRREASLASKQVQTRDAKEASQFRFVVTQSMSEKKQRVRKEGWARFLDSLSTYDHEMPWRTFRKKGRSEWLQRREEYRQWSLALESVFFLYTAVLGGGKSTAMASLIEDSQVSDTRSCTCWFYCIPDDMVSRRPMEIIGSVARQLLSSSASEESSFEAFVKGTGNKDETALLDLVKSLLPTEKRSIFIYLDGLDQCDQQSSQTVLKWIQDLTKDSSHIFHIFITTRPEMMTRAVSKLEPKHKVSTSTSEDDLKTELSEYVENELEKKIESDDLTLGDPYLIFKIRDVLVEKAETMFLWVDFQLKLICAQRSDKDILYALENVPKDIWETYDRILDSLSERSEADIRLAKFLFSTLSVARRPLTKTELRDAYNVVPGQTSWATDGLINDLRTMLDCCGSLIVQDEENLRVQFAHSSIETHISHPTASAYNNLFWVDKENANLLLGEICLTYLNLDIFQKQVIKRRTGDQSKGINPPADIVASVFSRHQTSKKTALALLKSVSKGQSNQKWHPQSSIETFKPQNSHDAEAFFLDYATKNWPYHTSRINESSTKIQNLFQQSILHLQDVDGIPWPSKSNISENFSNDAARLLSWAGRQSHPYIFSAVLEALAQSAEYFHFTQFREFRPSDFVNERDRFLARLPPGIKPQNYLDLFVTAIYRHEDFMKGPKPNWNHAPSFLRVCLHSCLYEIDSENTTLLLKHGWETLVTMQEEFAADGVLCYYLEPILVALNRDTDKKRRDSAKEIVRALIQHEIGLREDPTSTLLTACRMGLDVLELVIRSGVDVNCVNEYGETFLELFWSSTSVARILDPRKMLAVLLDADAKVESLAVLVHVVVSCKMSANLQHLAIINCIRTLIEAGVDINARLKRPIKTHGGVGSMTLNKGATPLMAACYFPENYDEASYLLQEGANVSLRDDKGSDALCTACSFGCYATARQLVAHGARVHARCNPNAFQRTLLHCRDLKIARDLLLWEAFEDMDLAATYLQGDPSKMTESYMKSQGNALQQEMLRREALKSNAITEGSVVSSS